MHRCIGQVPASHSLQRLVSYILPFVSRCTDDTIIEPSRINPDLLGLTRFTSSKFLKNSRDFRFQLSAFNAQQTLRTNNR